MESLALRQLVASNIRRIAGARGLTITRLADFAEVSRPSLQHALEGRNAMTTDRLAQLAEILKVHPAELFVDPESGISIHRGPSSVRKGS